MSVPAMAWAALLAYAAVSVALTVRAARRTTTLASYAVGSRDIPAWVVGLSLSAQLTSVATFVINPGLVHAFGLSALLGYGVAAGLGITLGLAFLSRRFREGGTRVKALTVPNWIGERYGSPGLRALFSVLSLGLVTFAVLIVVALALVLSSLTGVSPGAWAAGITLFTVLSIVLGGATGHAWVNAAQAAVMLVVALVLLGKGLPLLLGEPGLLARMAAIDPLLAAPVNPASAYFRTVFEVFVCNFVVGIAIVCQPHVLSKSLYLREDRDVRRYLATAIGAGLVFTSVLLTGLYARVAIPGSMPIDRVIPLWITQAFPPAVQVLVAIGMLCAGLSTLEGIFLALSSIVSVDVYATIARRRGDEVDPARALRAGRLSLFVIGAVSVALAFWQLSHPTGGSVAIFAQYGVYLLFTASFLPLACGMFLPRATKGVVALGVATSLVVYLGLGLFRLSPYANNPGFLAACAILAGWAVVALGLLVSPRSARSPAGS